jgi:hypothetical protein
LADSLHPEEFWTAVVSIGAQTPGWVS